MNTWKYGEEVRDFKNPSFFLPSKLLSPGFLIMLDLLNTNYRRAFTQPDLREGLPVQIIPKYRHCLNGGGGVWPLPGFLWRICPHALRALKGDHSSPKSDNFPTKVFLFPQNRSFNHIYLTFSLSNMIYALLLKKCHESHLRISMGQIAQDAWGGGST